MCAEKCKNRPPILVALALTDVILGGAGGAAHKPAMWGRYVATNSSAWCGGEKKQISVKSVLMFLWSLESTFSRLGGKYDTHLHIWSKYVFACVRTMCCWWFAYMLWWLRFAFLQSTARCGFMLIGMYGTHLKYDTYDRIRQIML